MDFPDAVYVAVAGGAFGRLWCRIFNPKKCSGGDTPIPVKREKGRTEGKGGKGEK